MPMGHVDKARTFIEGLATRDPDLAASHIHASAYLEHDPSVADGVAGLKEHVSRLPEAVHLEVIRAFEDGAYVFTQSQGELLGRNVFFDVFRFDEGLIVEHWTFGTQGAPPNRSGHTQADGPTEPKELANTEVNKAIVREYYENVHLGGNHDRIRRYMSGERQTRHEPGVEDGVTAFERDLAILVRNRTIDRIGLLLGQGDFVFLVAEGTHETRPCVYVDLYRVEAGKLVEHWGFPEEIPARQAWKNGNGMV